MDILNILSEEIRKNIPRLMEIKKGCFIKITKGRNKNKIVEVHKPLYRLNNNELYAIHYIKNKQHTDEIGYLQLSDCEVIGSDITLIDVLEWLNKISLISYCMSSSGEFFYWVAGCAPETWSNVYWDLSKLYLKEQKEEVINFLNDIKNENV